MPRRRPPRPQPDERGSRADHPHLADDLPGDVVEAAEGEPEEERGVGDRRRRRRGEDRQHQPAAAERRVDRLVQRLRDREGDERCEGQRRRRDREGQRRPRRNAGGRPPRAEVPVDDVAQHERSADHQHARRRRQPEADRDQARAARHAGRADMADQPVRRRHGGEVEQERDHDASFRRSSAARPTRATSTISIAGTSTRVWTMQSIETNSVRCSRSEPQTRQ